MVYHYHNRNIIFPLSRTFYTEPINNNNNNNNNIPNIVTTYYYVLRRYFGLLIKWPGSAGEISHVAIRIGTRYSII